MEFFTLFKTRNFEDERRYKMETATVVVIVILILALLFFGLTFISSNNNGGSSTIKSYPQGQVIGGGCGR